MIESRQGWLAHPHPIPRPLRAWLSDTGSLTRRLKARCAHFRVLPLAVGIARPNADEVELLGLKPGMRAYVREVLLLCNEIPVVFAHSVLPCAGLRGGWNDITRLGTRSLGEALFNDHRIQRQPLAYKAVRRGHPLFDRIAAPHAQVRALWARRSLFCLHSHPLLVTEVFLPAIESL
ncbi:MAG: chorismate--pyruvate lyase family protein [Thiobacillus sp.]